MIKSIMTQKKPAKILLSFDIEEFDLPLEYGQSLDKSEQLAISRQGLFCLLPLLEELQIRVTFFVTAYFAIHHQSLIKKLSEHHEIASHSWEHSHFSLEDLTRSKKQLEKITETEIIGFRMARLKPIDEQEIYQAGYLYNSSLNPTYLPGRYNNLDQPRTFYYHEKLLNVPVSVTPLIRFPLFWLSFKHLPLILMKFASQITLTHDTYLSLYFHPWEFTDLSPFSIPNYIKKDSGQVMLNKLQKYLSWLKTQGDFITFSDFLIDH